MTYGALCDELRALSDEGYRVFHGGLLKDPAIRLMGVRVPDLRRLAKKYRGMLEEFLAFPDEWYEVTFLKCQILALQPYETYLGSLDRVLPLIRDWATCDCISPPCVKAHAEDYLRKLLTLRASEKTFTARFALVQLLRFYCKREYFPVLFESAAACDHSDYYVSMAAAWLAAEIVVRDFAAGSAFLASGRLPDPTLHRAVRKACDSFRLSAEQKDLLRAIK